MKRMIVFGLLIVALVACQRETATEPAEGTAADTAATATTEPPITPDLVKLAVEEPVVVTIRNDGIDVAEQPFPGATRFQVTNESDQVRTLVIEGPSVRAPLEAPLQPLETRTITVDVQAGTYRFVSPAPADGRELSKEITVVVPEGTPPTTGT